MPLAAPVTSAVRPVRSRDSVVVGMRQRLGTTPQATDVRQAHSSAVTCVASAR